MAASPPRNHASSGAASAAWGVLGGVPGSADAAGEAGGVGGVAGITLGSAAAGGGLAPASGGVEDGSEWKG